IRVRPDVLRVEREHDAVSGNARRNQLRGDSLFGPVALDPELPVNQIDVDDATVNTPVRPAHDHEQVVIALGVEDGQGLQLADRVGDARPLGEQFHDQTPIVSEGTHLTTSRVLSSKTRIRMPSRSIMSLPIGSSKTSWKVC